MVCVADIMNETSHWEPPPHGYPCRHRHFVGLIHAPHILYLLVMNLEPLHMHKDRSSAGVAAGNSEPGTDPDALWNLDKWDHSWNRKAARRVAHVRQVKTRKPTVWEEYRRSTK
jgi:hypothetical protein